MTLTAPQSTLGAVHYFHVMRDESIPPSGKPKTVRVYLMRSLPVVCLVMDTTELCRDQLDHYIDMAHISFTYYVPIIPH